MDSAEIARRWLAFFEQRQHTVVPSASLIADDPTLLLVNAGMASAYAAKGVRVNAVNPGLTLTDRLQEGMDTDARAQGITAQEAMQRANARIPMGRIARAEEVADAVVYLASARASYISGVVLTMDQWTALAERLNAWL